MKSDYFHYPCLSKIVRHCEMKATPSCVNKYAIRLTFDQTKQDSKCFMTARNVYLSKAVATYKPFFPGWKNKTETKRRNHTLHDISSQLGS